MPIRLVILSILLMLYCQTSLAQDTEDTRRQAVDVQLNSISKSGKNYHKEKARQIYEQLLGDDYNLAILTNKQLIRIYKEYSDLLRDLALDSRKRHNGEFAVLMEKRRNIGIEFFNKVNFSRAETTLDLLESDWNRVEAIVFNILDSSNSLVSNSDTYTARKFYYENDIQRLPFTRGHHNQEIFSQWRTRLFLKSCGYSRQDYTDDVVINNLIKSKDQLSNWLTFKRELESHLRQNSFDSYVQSMAQQVDRIISKVDPNAEKPPEIEFQITSKENKITTEPIDIFVKIINKNQSNYLISELSMELPRSLARSTKLRRIEFSPISRSVGIGQVINSTEQIFQATIPEADTSNIFQLYLFPSVSHELKINAIYTSLSGRVGSSPPPVFELKTHDPYITLLIWGMLGALLLNILIYFYFYHVQKLDIKFKDLLLFFMIGITIYSISLTFNENNIDIISKLGFSYKINTKTGAFLLGLMTNLATDSIVKMLFNKKDGERFPTIIGKKFKKRIESKVKKLKAP